MKDQFNQMKRKLIRWVIAHKKELIIAGISISTLIGIILALKHPSGLKKVWAILREAIKPSKTNLENEIVTKNECVHVAIADLLPAVSSDTQTKSLIDVSKHVRTLPTGCHASSEKIATALENGINLQSGQTWVKPYSKSRLTA